LGLIVKDLLLDIKHLLVKLNMNPDRAPDEVAGIVKKLEYLDRLGRYTLLLKNLTKCNDINNFKSIIVEATFAYSFEAVNMPLFYEESQTENQESSIDFLLNTQDGKNIYFEIRVNQQQKQTQKEIAQQLSQNNMYSVSWNGMEEQKDIIRLQSNILSKVQGKDGVPTKFFTATSGVFNIVAVDITELLLGVVDKNDCILAAYGDPYVEERYRRNIFGLFQKPKQNYPDFILDVYKKFFHFRKTIHGILFLVRHSLSGPLDFELRYLLIQNIDLVSDSMAKLLDNELLRALTPWDDR